MNKSVLQFLAAMAVWTSASADHAPRRVVVNGLPLNDVQIAWLEQRNCSPVPNGSYWLNLSTGAWGYAGWPLAQGHIGAACGGSSSRHKSLSERGMLYRPGEIIDGR